MDSKYTSTPQCEDVQTFKVPIPLTKKPRERILPSPDCTGIAKEIFQETLQEEILHTDLAHNLIQSTASGTPINDLAWRVKAAQHRYDYLMEDILSVENNIKNRISEQIEIETISEKSPIDIPKLRQEKLLFRDLDKNDVENYNLLRSTDLLKDVYNENPVNFQQFSPNNRRSIATTIAQQSISERNKSLPRSITTKNINTSKNSINTIAVLKSKTTDKPVILIAEPNQVIFANCKPGQLYKSTVNLKNVSRVLGKFSILSLGPGSKFKVQWNILSGCTKIVAPGLLMKIIISHIGDPYEDTTQTLKINVLGGLPVCISIKSMREPPHLQVLTLPQFKDEDTVKDIIKKETIESSGCFIGDSVTTIIPLLNKGGQGRFWICNEESWCFAEIKDIPLDNILIMSPYSISPFYFSLGTDDVMELCIRFQPTETGVSTETLHVISDNCTVRVLELIGDAMLFHKYYFEFQDMEKSFEVNRDDDEGCQYWIDLGKSLSFQNTNKLFTIKNTSNLKMAYHWEERKPKIHTISREILHELPEKTITITPASGILLPKSSNTLTVSCQLPGVDVGHYRHVLSLVIENIPSAAITDESCIKVRRNSCSEWVDIVVGEVEFWLTVVPLEVTLSPSIICLAGEKLRVSQSEVCREVFITNHMDWEVTVMWRIPNWAREVIGLAIKPENTKLAPHTSLLTTVTIHALYPGEIFRKIQCIINDGVKTLELVITGEVSGPLAEISNYHLDFGIVRRGDPVRTTFTAVNESFVPVIWSLEEFFYNLNDRHFYLKEGPSTEESFGFLSHKGSACEIPYNLDTNYIGLYCSLLRLSSITCAQSTPIAYILVTADVIMPKLDVQAPVEHTAVLHVCNQLYVGKSTRHKIQLRNRSKALGSFEWGKPIGCDVSKLKVKFKPSKGTIEKGSVRTVKVYIVPNETGNITHFYVPCVVGRERIPLILSIICNVDCLNVTFHLPKKADETQFTDKDYLNISPISWSLRGRDINYPRTPIPVSQRKALANVKVCTCLIAEENSNKSNEMVDDEKPEEVIRIVNLSSVCSVHLEEIVVSSLAVEETEETLIEEILTEPDMEETTLPEVVETPETPCIGLASEDLQTKEFLQGLDRDVILIETPMLLKVVDIDEVPPPVTPPKEKSLEIFPSSKSSLLEWLRSYAVIEFLDVPCFKPVRRMFLVRNETPLPAYLKVEVTNFPERDRDSEINVFQRTLAEVNGIHIDEWQPRMRPNVGVVVVIEKCSEYLESHGAVPVFVWVYADTWGNYFETITCFVTGLPPFTIQVEIHVTGRPLSFPMALHCKSSEPVLRFGTLAFGSDKKTRRIKVRNTSSVDVTVTWNTLMLEDYEEDQPFTLVLDIFTKQKRHCNEKEQEDTGMEIIQAPYSGEQTSMPFQVSPSEQHIPAKSDAFVEVSIDLTDEETMEGISSSFLHAVIIGYTRITRSQSNPTICTRYDGEELGPTNFHLEAGVELPQIIMLNCEEMNISASAVTLIDMLDDDFISFSRMTKLKNITKCTINAKIRATVPFEVTKVASLQKQKGDVILIFPGECVEVFLECHVCRADALRALEIMTSIPDPRNLTETLYDRRMKLNSKLKVYMNNLTKTTFELPYTINFPILQVTTRKIEFGPVLLNSKRKTRFELMNNTATPVRYWITQEVTNIMFTVTEGEQGVLPAAPQRHIYGGATVAVEFEPKIIGEHRTLLFVHTPIPDEVIDIRLEGCGTWDESNYYY